MIAIEKGVPIPEDERKHKYPWRDLEVGDSFLMDIDKRGSAGVTAKRIGIKVTTRKENDEYVRVWRTA